MVMPIKNGKVTTGYKKAGAWWSDGIHKGIDIACPAGTDVLAVADGKVIGIGTWGAAFGIESVIVKHGDVYAIYAHLSKALVKVGDKIKSGQHIGESGGRVDTAEHKKHDGNVSGPHLHFEVQKAPNWNRKGHIDPMTLINSGPTAGPVKKPSNK